MRWCPCIVWLPPKLIQSEVSIRVICNNLVCCKTGLNVDDKTPFNTFCGNVKNRLHVFYCPLSRTLNQIVLKHTIFVSDVKYPKVPNWTTFFQSSVSRVLLTLVGSPPSPRPGNANDPNRSVDTVPVSDKPVPKPQMNSPVMNGKHVYRNLSLERPHS